MQTVNDFINILASKGVKLSAEAGQLNCYAPRGSLTVDLRDGIVRYKPEIIAFLEGTQAPQRAEVSHSQIILLSEQERQKLRVFNATAADYPRDKCIHELFADQVAIDPGKTAAVFDGKSLSYLELYEASHDLALYLQSQGVGPDRIVGLCLERSLEMMVAVIATQLAGGAYLPLDPSYPDERLKYMLQDSEPRVILTQERFRERIGSLAPRDASVLALDSQQSELAGYVSVLTDAGVTLRNGVRSHNLSYVIYTSGSTGKPKGVLVEHRALVNRIVWMQEQYRLTPSDVVLQKTPYSFDVSVWEFFWPMIAGASVVLAAPEGHKDVDYLENLIDGAQVTTLHYVPSMLHAFLDHAKGECRRVRQIFCSGEALDRRAVDGYPSRFPNAVLHNLYGPTEAAIDVTFYDCSKLTLPFVPIGKPISNIQIHILDPLGNPRPLGTPGELHIAGDGLARGYLNRPELTLEKFVANPFTPGARMYKTGDLARWLDDGNIQYLGRIDNQVKIRGYRIELGEIEARLNQDPRIQDSVVIARGEDANKHLVAFYRAKGTTADHVVKLPIDEIRAHLLITLPDYMVPAAFVGLAVIPLSSSGKVDRRALAELEVTMSSGQDYLAPRNDTEKQLVDLWAEVLNVAPEKTGINDSFFELGGNSLLATRLVSKLRSQLDIEVPVSAVFERTSIAQLAELVAAAHKSGIPPIRPIDRTQYERLPLSFVQERVWFINELEPDSAGYNVPAAVTLHGELNAGHLEETFRLIIARHEILRTVFPSHEGRAEQRILDRLDFNIERLDLSHIESSATREEQAHEICRLDAAAPFDLAGGPLLRVKLIKLAEQEHILMLNMHHIISDGWSLGVLIKELRLITDALREGRRPELPPLPIQYADYSIWQRNWLEESGTLKQQLAYWQEKLTGAPESLDLMTDYARPSVQSYAGATHAFVIDAQLTRQLESLAQQNGGTLYMILLAAFKTLLYRYTGQSDFCVGTPIANRQYGETEGLIGMFVNTLALRNQIEGNETFSAVLKQVRAACLQAYENQDAPFEKVVDILRLQRNLAISPIFQVMFILQDADMGALDQRFPHRPLESGISLFDLTAEFTQTAEGLAALFRYSTALYKPATIERMAGHFTSLCRAITSMPSATILDLDYLSGAEKQRLLVDFNQSRAAVSAGWCLHERFDEQAARHAEKTALVCDDERLTYQQLQERSHALALYLQSEGVGPDQRVGLCMERSLDMVVGLLGVLQAGGAYVPLDPEYPDDRISYMIEDSGAAIVLTQETLLGRLAELTPAHTRLVAMDRQWPEIADRAAASRADAIPLRQQVEPHHLAYVMYTSGSTGRPKGVMVEHRQIASYMTAIQNALQIPEGSSFALASTFAADLGNTVLFPALLGGGTLHVLSREAMTDADRYASYCREHRIDCMKVTPSHLQALVGERTDRCLIPAHTLVLGGEVLTRGVVELIRRINPECRIYNHYGPTECSVGVLCGEVGAGAQPVRGSLPLGLPLGGTRIYIVDGKGQPVPIGVAGDLCIGGSQVARGYLNQSALTAERFVADRFQPEAGARIYKTGDVARWLLDGTVEYLGRNDFQVKIRGFRIELGEVEAAMARHPGVKETVVIAREDEPGEKRLVAYMTATGDAVEVEELRSHMLASVPRYMVPGAFVLLEAMPLTPNGKVDRKALPPPESQAYANQEYERPQGEIEETLAAIWQELLHVERVGRHDNFFELGGHSLLATQLISKIRRRLDIDVPLKAVFERASIARFAELAARAGTSEIPPIRPVDRTQLERLPLSFAQERLWFINQLEPDGTGYNVPRAVTIRGELHLDQLDQAFNLIIARHENLRTLFPSQEGRAQQLILDRVDFKLDRIDLSHDENKDGRAKEICEIEAATPFDLARGPLLRGKVIRLAEHEHILMFHMHHIVSDGWSLGILIKELGEILEASREERSPELPPLPIQYLDYSVWQRTWLEESGTLEQQLAYWKGKLAGIPESLGLVTDYPRPSVQSFAGSTRPLALDARLTGELKSLAEQGGGTLYMVLLAAFDILLHRYSGQNDICVGSPIANRQYGDTEELIGMFANTLALRSQVEGSGTFQSLLSQVKATCLEAYEHQDAPFEKVVEVLHLPRNLAISPVFQAMVILQNADIGTLDERFPRYPLESASKFDLTVELTETPDGLTGVIEYSTALYKQQTVARLAEHFVALCRAIAAAPDAKIRELDYLGEAERQRLLIDYNATHADYPGDQCLHQMFVEQVARHSDKPAVVCGDEQLTYQQLYEKSRTLASYLQSEGVRPDSLVGLCMERSLDMLVGMLGILQAGGAYVPLDPEYPDDRLAYMLQDSRATIVLTQEKLQGQLGALMPAGTQLVAIDRQWQAIGDRVAELTENGLVLRQEVTPRHLAYVIYTSGSTGQPKGVAIEHHSPVTLVHWASEVYSREELAGVLASTSICFDLSVYEIFVTLANGGTIILVPNALGLINLSTPTEVTLINTVPSAMEELVRSGAIPDSVKTINLAGEPLSTVLVDKIYTTTKAKKVYDLYGPSEDTTYSTHVLRKPDALATIGRPIANTQVYILDPDGHLQPIGVPGELHIAGDGLARGYLHRDELTRDKFVANPFAPGTRMYKTGDLARWLDDGNIQYLGRIDTQVKIRGFRIELGEIEARLGEHTEIQDSAVIAHGEQGARQLVAFYRAAGTTAHHVVQVPYEELRAHLIRTLPEYMVPAAFVSLPAIPLNPNGKVDRRALARMDVTIESGQEYVAPRNETESHLVEIWAEVLKVAPEKIGVNDNFFELGGHSLLATQLISKIRSQMNVDVPLKALFERTCVARFAASIAKAGPSDIPPIRPVDRAQFERLPLSFAQERLWFINELEPDSAGYNVPRAVTVRGELDLDQMDHALNLIIARHENLRTVFPSEEGQAQQLILDRIDFALERISLSHDESREARDRKAKEICQTEAATPFDLSRGPLLRGLTIKLDEHEHILMLNMHHIISDGWSLGVLIKEIGSIMEALREGRNPELAPLPIQYLDYSVWQRRWLEEGGILDQHLAYWQEKLAGGPESLDLVTDYPRPSVQSFAGATHDFTLDAELSGQLKRLAEQKGGTMYMVLLAAFKVLLYRYTGQSDLCVGSPIANRQYGETEGLIGMFANTLALRSQVEGKETFSALLSQVKTTCLEAYEHQDAPFEKVVDILHPQRNLAISPIFQVMVVLQNVDIGALDQRFPRYALDSGISKFDLTAEFTETPDGLAGSLEYSTALFKPRTIARMVEHFKALCRAIAATPATRIGDLDYLGEAEKHRLLVDFNATHADYPSRECLHQLFIDQVAQHAGEPAVVCGDVHLTYRQLYDKSQTLASYLQSAGVGPDALVGLCMERSLDMLVGMLGILQAGGAYVPLDPEHPDDRLAYMLQDSQAAIVLTQERLQHKLSALMPAGTQLIAIDRQWSEIHERAAELNANGVALQQQVTPHHLAYVIYTSGSTGLPKGVAIEHHSPVTLVHWASSVYSREELAGMLASTSICFDLSVYEIFVTLANGGTIILVPNALGLTNLSNATDITLINTVPSAMEELVRLGAIPDSVKTINLAGEPLSTALVDRIYTTTKAGKVYDLYGPSEDTTYSTYVLRRPNAPATIGRPIANTQVYILDSHGHPQPIGVPGELHISGDGLARGYLHRRELTHDKFVANPFAPGTRMYKTGDLARWLDDGNIQYLGRIDTQVKIRGFRIELGEIEGQLNAHFEIQDSAVVAQVHEGTRHLVAFYRASDTTADQLVHLPFEELRSHLLRKLPEYMVPAAFVSLTAIPLNPNGKVDRRALARMDVTIASGQAYIAPRNDIEKQLVEIWAEVLKLSPESIGVNDSFFELGGHSLLATRLIAKIRSRMAIDVPLKALFERTTVARFAELLPNAAKSDIPPIRVADRSTFERLPLSFAQERVWFFDQLEPGSVRYNVPTAATISGELEISQLDEAFNLIIARHENLRTLFPSLDGQARQLILERIDFRLERIDLSQGESKEARDRSAKEICEIEAKTPFDLARGPLLRGKVIRLAEDEHILMLNMHHIISDGWSTGILIKELSVILEALRAGRRPELPALPIQYADYSVWQRTWLKENGVLDKQLGYWKEKLAGVPESLDLVTDYPRPSVQSVAGAVHEFALDSHLTAQLKRLAEQGGGTLYMTLLAAFNVLLHRYTGQQDICVGSLIANRQHEETEGLIGIFFNTLALRSQVEGEDTFVSLLSQVRDTCLEAYEHQDTPFEKVVDALRPQRNLAISPIFQVMVALHNVDSGQLEQHMKAYPLESGVSQFDLTAAFIERPEGLTGYLIYGTALFKPQTIARMAGHFMALCSEITAAPSARLRDLDYIGEAEKRQLLIEYNDTRADYPTDKCIHDFFAEQVLAGPDSTAVVSGDQVLSYQELNDRCGELALYVQSMGVQPDDIVGLCLERSAEMMLGVMGTVQAGGAYLPADPSYPDDRLAYMLQDSQASVILTQGKFKRRLRSLLEEDTIVIALDTEWAEIRERVAALKAEGVALRRDVKPGNVAYLIYTSGSTGRPKGVLVEHLALVNRIHWMQKSYPLAQADVVLQKTPYGFDVSVWELFWPMMTGASVVFAEPEGHKDVHYLENLINETNVTTLHFVPSMLHTFLDNARTRCNSVRQIFCSGEALDRKSVDRYKTRFPNAAMHNLYGPTEAAIDVTAYDCSQLSYPFVPIGAPIDNIQIYILDEHQHPQPIGVPGELHIAGDGLAREYLDRPELTAEKFVASPFTPGARMYKTGDLARWLDDGNIQYLGRIDTQVKIRGFRIETGEIEAQLNQHPRIKDSAVIAQGEAADKQLIAFYRATKTQADDVVQLPYEELRAHLLRTLPEHMVPAAFVSLAAIPLSSNGKVDRRALSGMDVRIESAREYVAPRNERERQLVEVWAQVLSREPETIGVEDNFFELGGHSLLAVKLIERMRQQGLHASLQALFNAPTLAKLAVAIEADPNIGVAAEERVLDLEQEAILDPAIVLRTVGMPGEMRNTLLTGATGFLGAFLLYELLTETSTNVHCLVRAAGPAAGARKIEEKLKYFGLWDPSFGGRILPVVGDLTSPLLGLTHEKFEELAGVVDVIYHSGATVNFYYPYSVLKAANVLSTEELLRMASIGRAKSFHFISTLGVVLAPGEEGPRPVISENDPIPEARALTGGYGQTKWVAEKLVGIAASRGIPVVIYRPGTIMGHSRTGATSLNDFVPSFIRGCIQAGSVPEVDPHDEVHLMPVDYVSRTIVAISSQPEHYGRSFNLTHPRGTTRQEMLDRLLTFDPTLQRVPYEEWRSQVAGDPGNTLARFIASLPEQSSTAGQVVVRSQFDSAATIRIMEAAGIDRPQISHQLLDTYFSYLAEHTVSRAGVGAE